MAKSTLALLVAAVLPASALTAQTGSAPASGYHRAPDAIARILEATPVPIVSVSPDHRTLAILGRESLPTIANMSKPIQRLGGFRIDPATNGQAEVRVQWLDTLTLQDLASGKKTAVALPAGTRFTNVSWSPDGTRLAMVVQGPASLALWTTGLDGKRHSVADHVNAGCCQSNANRSPHDAVWALGVRLSSRGSATPPGRRSVVPCRSGGRRGGVRG